MLWSFFQISVNFDLVKEILKIRCQISILKKKVIILRKIQVTMKTLAPPFFIHFSLVRQMRILQIERTRLLCCRESDTVLRQNPGARGKHLAIQLLLASAGLLVTRVSRICVVDEFFFLFPV